NPAFGPAQIRELTKVFADKSIELRDALSQTIQKESGVGHIDGLMWLTRMTLDVIGQAAFGYQFNAMQGKPNELNTAFSRIFETGVNQLTPFVLVQLVWSFLRSLPDANTNIRQAHSTMDIIGKGLLADRKRAFDSHDEKDVLSLLLKYNSLDVPEGQRMSDSQILAQVPTFLVAGHETTRVAVKNDVIPLSEPYTDKNGVVHHALRIKYGTEVQIPIISLHRDTSLWGDDALEFT
ncbi:hypothetical protein MPER_04386, partial [Moniliophthora perniciosa FA553]